MIAINKIDRPNADVVSERTFIIDTVKHLIITYFAGMKVVLGKSELHIREFVESQCYNSYIYILQCGKPLILKL